MAYISKGGMAQGSGSIAQFHRVTQPLGLIALQVSLLHCGWQKTHSAIAAVLLEYLFPYITKVSN
ncbi:MAG: hypothetical protein MH252_14475 [Thermosynechococcaceae cyanobacterium MS004]|nr:hypothetical protein [Thermosynechococcaceae cyanobacterium MS004]